MRRPNFSTNSRHDILSRRKNARQRRDEMLQLCGEIHEDDGIDQREYLKAHSRGRNDNRKTLQLCSQVAQTLHMVLADCDDPLVQMMNVTMVTPNPDGSCLRVHIVCDKPRSHEQAMIAIEKQTARLRFEVSRSIHRKRVPNLVFSLSISEQGASDE